MSNIEDISLKVFHYCILCKQVEFSETLVIVNVEELCEVLVFIDTRLQANSEDTFYVCRLPNRYGHSVFK